jgi:hypothetical protein
LEHVQSSSLATLRNHSQCFYCEALTGDCQTMGGTELGKRVKREGL